MTERSQASPGDGSTSQAAVPSFWALHRTIMASLGGPACPRSSCLPIKPAGAEQDGAALWLACDKAPASRLLQASACPPTACGWLWAPRAAR